MIDPSVPGRIAFATCTKLPDLDPDDRLALRPLAALGARVDAVSWDDPDVDWRAFDLVVLRSTWDYARRRDEFVAWASGVSRLANPADIVAWNTDKRYLRELGLAGVPIVATQWVGPADMWRLPATGTWVIKPAVSAGSLDTGRYNAIEPEHRELAAAHVARLQAAGRLVMVQPYLPAIDADGETAFVFLGGAYSHAVRKGALLRGPEVAVAGLFQPEEIARREPTAAQLAVAEQALAAVPRGAGRLLYARVDLIPGSDGEPQLGELELTEPSLFLGMADGAPDRFARAVLASVAACAT